MTTDTSVSPSVSYRGWLLFGLLYLAFAAFYMVSLRLSFLDYSDMEGGFNWRILYLDYPLKALFSLPVWYFVFRVFHRWSLERKLLLNIILMPLWIKGWQLSYYWISDAFFGRGTLQGSSGEWWDVYIPGLFYVLQFGILHAWHFHRNWLETERERAESQRLALGSELSALKAQLNPHFLYNALNTISASVGPAQEGTRRMVAQLSDLFRYQLAANRRENVTLREELEFVADYLRLEKARFQERLDFQLEPTEGSPLDEALIPPLMLQPLVENAVRHGVSPSLIGGEVYVSARAESDHLILTVFNTGCPCDPAKCASGKGFGLTNTRRRLALLFASELSIWSSPEGTTCTFTIPLQYAPDRTSDRRRNPRPQSPPRVPTTVS